jgi:hypothetical protein
MPTQIPTTQARTLELLTRIAVALEALTERIDHLVETGDTTAEHAAQTAEALSRFGQAMAAAPLAGGLAPETPQGQTVVFLGEKITLGYDDNGKPIYKVFGGRYQKFGVRCWPEALPLLGVDAGSLKPGPNVFGKTIVALMGEKGPQKVIGLAN